MTTNGRRYRVAWLAQQTICRYLLLSYCDTLLEVAISKPTVLSLQDVPKGRVHVEAEWMSLLEAT